MGSAAYEEELWLMCICSGSAVRRLGAAFTVGRGGGRIPCRPTSQMMRNRTERGRTPARVPGCQRTVEWMRMHADPAHAAPLRLPLHCASSSVPSRPCASRSLARLCAHQAASLSSSLRRSTTLP